MSPQRVLLFFVPHVALVLIIVIGDHLWRDWSTPVLLVSAALPWWYRVVLGLALLVVAYAYIVFERQRHRA